MRTTDAFSRATGGVLETADGAWRYAVKTPRPACNRWVTKLWELDGACPPARERELPRADISLIVNLAGRHAVVDHDDPGAVRVFNDAWVSGLQERAFVTASGGRAWLCGARLTVEGAYRVFGVAPQQLANRIVDLDAIHGGAAHSMVDAIRNAASVETRLTILGEYLVAQAMRTCKWDASVAWALERIATSEGCTTVGASRGRSAGVEDICIGDSSIRSGSAQRRAFSSRAFILRSERWKTCARNLWPRRLSVLAISIKPILRGSST
jgi:hypothetical protein